MICFAVAAARRGDAPPVKNEVSGYHEREDSAGDGQARSMAMSHAEYRTHSGSVPLRSKTEPLYTQCPS